MPQAIIDLNFNAIVGIANNGVTAAKHQVLVPLPEDFNPDDVAEWAYDGQGLTRDTVAFLDRAKAARKVRIKAESARLIEAIDWKLARAQEREAAGWATLAEVDVVLAERESIRRSSNAAEVALDALTDVVSVQSFTWSVDVQVPAPRRLTQTKFAERFTDAELQAILSAAAASAALNGWWKKFELADDINLDDPATRAGVQALEFAGVIGVGRAAEVLA